MTRTQAALNALKARKVVAAMLATTVMVLTGYLVPKPGRDRIVRQAAAKPCRAPAFSGFTLPS